MKKNTIKALALATLLLLPSTIMATEFWKSGTIDRILIDTKSYGKCMIKLPVSIGNSCTSNWVSLDCEGKYLDKGDGDRLLNIALIAQNMGKRISVKVDNSKKFGGYCVATRIDILK